MHSANAIVNVVKGGSHNVLETVLQFYEHLGVVVVDGKATAVGMEEVVAEDSVKLVVQSIVSTQAIKTPTR